MPEADGERGVFSNFCSSAPHGSYTSVPPMAVALLAKFLFRAITNARAIAITIAIAIAIATADALIIAVVITNPIHLI